MKFVQVEGTGRGLAFECKEMGYQRKLECGLEVMMDVGRAPSIYPSWLPLHLAGQEHSGVRTLHHGQTGAKSSRTLASQ